MSMFSQSVSSLPNRGRRVLLPLLYGDLPLPKLPARPHEVQVRPPASDPPYGADGSVRAASPGTHPPRRARASLPDAGLRLPRGEPGETPPRRLPLPGIPCLLPPTPDTGRRRRCSGRRRSSSEDSIIIVVNFRWAAEHRHVALAGF